MLSNLLLINVIHIIYFEYLRNFDAPVLFLGLVRGGIVVPSTVEIDKLSVSLSNTCLDKRKQKKKKCGCRLLIIKNKQSILVIH